MDFQHLEVFLNIAKFKNLTKASREMHCVQSALSHKLKQLEDELDTSLFIRKKYGMELSDSGLRFLEYAQNLLDLRKEAKAELNKKPELIRSLNLGFQESFFRSSFAEKINFTDLNEVFDLGMKFGFAENLLDLLTDKKIDFAVISARKAPKQFQVHKKIDDEMVLVLPKVASTIKDLDFNKVKPFHLGEACFFARSLQYFLEEHSILINLDSKINSLESIVTLISKGLGFSILPKSFISQHYLKSKLNILKLQKRAKFSYFILQRKGCDLEICL